MPRPKLVLMPLKALPLELFDDKPKPLRSLDIPLIGVNPRGCIERMEIQTRTKGKTETETSNNQYQVCAEFVYLINPYRFFVRCWWQQC